MRRHKCPYCRNCKENEYVELINNRIFNVTGYAIESYKCSKCGNIFYTEKSLIVSEIDIRKTKYPIK